MTEPLEELESRIGHFFADRNLLLRALTHTSLVSDSPASPISDNEQLEFLGDSILGFLASEYVFSIAPDRAEGDLSRLKAHLVSASRLHEAALELGLGAYLRLGKGEEISGGRAKKALLADAVEAIIAAVYLDSAAAHSPARALDNCRAFLTRYIWGALAAGGPEQPTIPIDPKSALQELAQAQKLPMPRYTTIEEFGPEHAKSFTVEARLGRQHTARGTGSSKKNASRIAAELLLAQLLEAGDAVPAPS